MSVDWRFLWRGAAIFLLLALPACTGPQISGEPFETGNRLYEAGQFVDAAAAYQSLVDGGVADGALYYNLGNAYLKSGDLGRAVLNYRRAQQLLPRDPDVALNLRLARAQAQDRLEDETPGGLVGLARRVLVEGTTLNEAAVLALGLWVVGCGLVIAAMLRPRLRPVLTYALIATAVLLVLSVFSVGARLLDERHPPAVIVAPSVEAHSGPGPDYLTEFTLHTGAEVRIIEERAGWMRIALPGDLQGWVPEAAVEALAHGR
ncbi:MAG: tetratricopeptide repeat protein [Anaerolineae bacterium]|nr:tetratricopeptide repeat protein [Anaerolineae bacterium]